jgi:pyrroline-5-carboxylate reductase
MPIPALIIFGGGNMGGAIAQAIQAPGIDPPIASRVVIVEPDEDKHAPLAPYATCVKSIRDASRAITPADAMLLAVKPQSFPPLAEQLGATHLAEGRCVISIMAGVSCATLARTLPSARIVRTMPNLGLSVGLGMSAACAGPGATRDDLALTHAILGASGRVVDLPESLMDAFTAVAGSGPAYVFLLAEAMQDGARALGLDDAQADAIVRQTILGAATMLARDPRRADELRAGVTSKGGTTQAALTVLGEAGVRDALVRAIAAARNRGRELGA